MSDNVRPTLDDLTECWCGYQAPNARELMLHQLYCDPHNTAPKVIDDQRKQITELKAQLAAAQAEITRLRAGGCAREQGATHYCGEMQALVGRLTELAEEWREENCYDKGRRETLDWCADRLREAISGQQEQQVGLLEIADDVIAEREAADQKWADMRYGAEGER